jgi:hypothetical protein
VLDRKLAEQAVFPAIDIPEIRYAEGRAAGGQGYAPEDVDAAPDSQSDGDRRCSGIPAQQDEEHEEQCRVLLEHESVSNSVALWSNDLALNVTVKLFI